MSGNDDDYYELTIQQFPLKFGSLVNWRQYHSMNDLATQAK